MTCKKISKFVVLSRHIFVTKSMLNHDINITLHCSGETLHGRIYVGLHIRCCVDHTKVCWNLKHSKTFTRDYYNIKRVNVFSSFESSSWTFVHCLLRERSWGEKRAHHLTHRKTQTSVKYHDLQTHKHQFSRISQTLASRCAVRGHSLDLNKSKPQNEEEVGGDATVCWG